MTPAHARPTLGTVKATWIHTDNKTTPTPITHTPYVGRQPVTPDFSAVEVRPRADRASCGVSTLLCETRAGGQELPVQCQKENKTMAKAGAGHNELSQHKG